MSPTNPGSQQSHEGPSAVSSLGEGRPVFPRPNLLTPGTGARVVHCLDSKGSALSQQLLWQHTAIVAGLPLAPEYPQSHTRASVVCSLPSGPVLERDGQGTPPGCPWGSGSHVGTRRAMFTGSEQQPREYSCFQLFWKLPAAFPCWLLQAGTCQAHVESWQPTGAP